LYLFWTDAKEIAASEAVMFVTNKNSPIEYDAISEGTTVLRIKIAGAVQPLASRI